MRDFVNPLANPDLTYKGKTARERGKELLEEQRKKDLEERLNKKRKKQKPEVQAQPQTNQPSNITNEQDYLVLDNIVCTDSKGNEFEKYGRIYVAKDIVREQNGKLKRFTPYQGAVYFEQNGLFLPSFALSCNILAALFANKDDAEIKKVLMQYKDRGDSYGWHAQNTVVDYGNKRIIHYPNDNDFPNYGGNNNINNARARTALDFAKRGLSDTTLEEGLKKKNIETFVRNLTGLTNPRVLLEIGNYFGKTPRIWFRNQGARSAWLGCDSDSFDLYADNDLGNYDAARGVGKNFSIGNGGNIQNA